MKKQFISLICLRATSSEWQWDFGDGNSATGQSVVHTYDEEGIYNVCLTVM